MFITKHDGYLHIVNQYDHSVQAGEVTRRWGNEHFARPDYFDSLCLAVKKHDIGWVESDTKVLFNPETRQPVPFLNVNLLQHVEFYGQGYETVLAEDPYAGLLVGMHWIGLYTSRYGYDPSFTFNIPEDLVSLIEENTARQEKSWTDLKLQMWNRKEARSRFEDKLWMNYEIVQMMDRLSQYVSMHTPDTKNQWIVGPVRRSVDSEGCMITIQGQGDGTVVVDPFPFDSVVETTVLVRRIPDIRYGSHEEAYEAMEEAKKEPVVWRFIPPQK